MTIPVFTIQNLVYGKALAKKKVNSLDRKLIVEPILVGNDLNQLVWISNLSIHDPFDIHKQLEKVKMLLQHLKSNISTMIGKITIRKNFYDVFAYIEKKVNEGGGYDFKKKRVRTFRVNEIFGTISLLAGSLKGKEKGNFHSICRKSPFVTAAGFKPATF